MCFTTKRVCLGQVAAIECGTLLLDGLLHQTSELCGSPGATHSSPWSSRHRWLWTVTHLGITSGASGPIQSRVYQGRLTGRGPLWVQAGRNALFIENLMTIMKPTQSSICLLLSPRAGNSNNASNKITPP